MSVTIELAPETEAKYVAEAAERGMPLPELLKHVLEERTSPEPTARTPEERARLWRDSVRGLPHTTGPLSDEAISRETIYAERG